LTLLLLVFHSNSDSNSYNKTPFLSGAATTLKTDNKGAQLRKTARLFYNYLPFKVVSFANTLNKHTTDTDTLKCSNWTLAKQDIEKIIKNSEPINGTTWDLGFSVSACTKTVSVVQARQQFKIEINAASFFWVSNGDTSILFGDYKRSDRKYFLDHPNSE